MTGIWFCQITNNGRGFITNSAQEHRYRSSMYKMAEKEGAVILEYACREGKVFVMISALSESIVSKIIKTANSSFGKYLKMAGNNIHFKVEGPLLIQKIHDYSNIKQQFFYTFYVAEDNM